MTTQSVASREINHQRQQLPLTIWSFGRKAGHENPNCDLTIDLTEFHSVFDKRDISKATGLDPEIQSLMVAHPDYDAIMGHVVETLDNDHTLQSVAFMCSWGKHRSVAFAELLQREFYPNARVRHARFHQQKQHSGNHGDNSKGEQRPCTKMTRNKRKKKRQQRGARTNWKHDISMV